jgi:urate oxidase
VRIAEHPWRRIRVEGREHSHAFVGGGPETRVAAIARDRLGTRVEAGIEGLPVLKTAGSGFSGFIHDRYTTLPETTERIFATEVQAHWLYVEGSIDWDQAYNRVRTALLETFATHNSLAVQQTLHAMGTAALDVCPSIEEITLVLPNKHRILVDLARFDQVNQNEIYITTDEPFGLISGTLRRG